MSDDGQEELTPAEAEMWERQSRVRLNHHRVDLERVQRCHRGLDDEPMPFDELTVAEMLQDLADDAPFGHEAFVLSAVARALRGEDEHHKLVLRQTKKGRWESPADRTAKLVQQASWILEVNSLEADGWQTDAAVHKVAADQNLGVSTIYAGIREHAQWVEQIEGLSLLIASSKRRTPSTES